MKFPFLLNRLLSGEKKTFTANFAQSAENNVDPFFKNSDIYMCGIFPLCV